MTGAALLDRLAARLPVAARTRFAPAPTGYLHLGHVVNAIFVWGIARALGGRVLLRIEDHDATRCRPEFEAALLEDLTWLGLHADEGAPPGVVRQQERGAVYEAALAALDARGLVYACDCSRRLLAERQPDLPNVETAYPGRCRDRRLERAAGCGLRVMLPPDAIEIDDAAAGPLRQRPAEQCGDLLVRDRLGQWTYQFAVTADDQAQGVNLVVRGRDLLASTGRQMLLGRLLGRVEPPVFAHHTLLLRPDGAKLSKSDGATGIRELRAGGRSAEEVLGLAAFRAGLRAGPGSIGPDDLAGVIAGAPDMFPAATADE